ncbi:MAG: M48 family metalloprotease [bacterium]|nr:M48 family metalloprotease [bacterium]
MIYINFIYFIVAIFVFTAAPVVPGTMIDSGSDLLLIAGSLFLFWHLTKDRFLRLRKRLINNEITFDEARQRYSTLVNTHMLLGLLLFAAESFLFDLKAHILHIPILGYSGLFLNAIGLAIFIAHLSVVWYLAYHCMGETFELADTPQEYLISNIKFNLGIVLPWLILTFAFDALSLIPALKPMLDSKFFPPVSMAIFLVVLVVYGPVLIVRLWECEPLPPSELRSSIEAFCKARGVKFKDIMSWNALNKGLVTAGVIGVAPDYRYLMITPSLMDILNEDELMAVVSHEVGHVKKKHHLLYLFFFIVFFIFIANVGTTIMGWLNKIFITPSVILDYGLTGSVDGGIVNTLNIVFIIIFIALVIIYFRFVFGFFMRSFERQADGACFEDGTDPNHLIASFMKLGVRVGDDGKKKNWHHYNLTQRINFIRKGMQNPGSVKEHNIKTNKRVLLFSVIMLFIIMGSFSLDSPLDINYKEIATEIELRIEKKPDDPQLYALLGNLYYELKNWEASKKAYVYSVGLDANQPDTLNNLAWLLLKSEQESLLNPKQALKLAIKAVEGKKASNIMDTLAEAYYQNGMYKKAFEASKKALAIAVDNRAYLSKQLEKMKKKIEN